MDALARPLLVSPESTSRHHASHVHFLLIFCAVCDQVREYERFTPLSIEAEGLKRGYLDVQPGDCIVAFSRRDIYDIKQLIEAGTGQR